MCVQAACGGAMAQVLPRGACMRRTVSSVAIFGIVEIGKKKPPQMRRPVC